MTAIRVRFLHGWLRAAGREDAALMGTMGDDGGEWPPSPGRLFAALVAGGGSGASRRAPGDDSELRAIEAATAPRIVADAPSDIARSRLCDRFVVVDATVASRTQEYAGRSAGVARPGIRLAPRHPEVTYHWPDLDLGDEQLAALEWRAARVGYLGTSDAPAQVTLVDEPDAQAPAWVPDRDGAAAVAVPYPGQLDVLDRAFAEFTAGRSLPASTIRREVVRYRAPGVQPRVPQPVGPVLLWATFDRAYSGHRIVAVAEAVKGTVLGAFGRRGTPDDAPGYLTGHGLAHGEDRARYWPLPHVGERGDGRLFGVCVALPATCSKADQHLIRGALDGAQLRVAGTAPRLVSIFSGEPGPWTSNPRRWAGPYREWVSASPVVLTHHPKGDPTARDIERLCEHAGLPGPTAWEWARVPLMPGCIDLKPHQTVHGTNRPRPYGHLRLWFATEQRGPFALGQMRSLGLGLMAPVRTVTAERR